MIDKKKTAPDAGTSKGGKGDISTLNIPSESEIVKRLNQFGKRQRSGLIMIRLCPRCGVKTLNVEMSRNPISHYANVHICRKCYADEIDLHHADLPPKPLKTWDYVKAVMLS